MPPSRPRAAAAAHALDDARSETSTLLPGKDTTTSNSKEKHTSHHAPAHHPTSKSKRATAPSSHTAVISKAEPASSTITGASSETLKGGSLDEGGTPGIPWPTLPLSILHSYRHSHRLTCPTAFSSPHNQVILSDPSGLGRFSPTMSRARSAANASTTTTKTSTKAGNGNGNGSGKGNDSGNTNVNGKGNGNTNGKGVKKVTTGGRGSIRRTSKEQLALAVRKDFNSRPVNEVEVWGGFAVALGDGSAGSKGGGRKG